MFQTLKKKMKDQRGLTLIELLAVIVILGIIAAIAIPSILKTIDNSREDAIKADAKLILNAAKIYYAEHGGFKNDAGNDLASPQLTRTELETDYIDNITTFTATSPYTYTITDENNDKILEISGVGKKGSVQVTFDKDTINDVDTAAVSR